MLAPVLAWLALISDPDPAWTRTAIGAVLAFPPTATAMTVDVAVPKLVALARARESEAVVNAALDALIRLERYVELDALSDELWHDRAFLADKPDLNDSLRTIRLAFVRDILHTPGDQYEH